MDGSAKNFVESIQNVGFEVSDQPIRIIKINWNPYSEVLRLFSFFKGKKIFYCFSVSSTILFFSIIIFLSL